MNSVQLEDKYALARGRVYLTGIQALARLALMQAQRDAATGLNTAGFVSGYQGSPLNHVDKVMREAKPWLDAHRVRFQPGQNEELAALSVWGTQQVSLDPQARHQGVFALWYGKWAGVARCGDVLHHGNAAGAAPHGGVLLVCGDDHMARSSTVATQSEHMVMAPLIPVLAPANVQDYLDLGLHGWAMSRFSGSWIAMKALDETIEGAASVEVDPARVVVRTPAHFRLPRGGLGLRLPDQPLTMERRIHELRLPAVFAYALENRLNFTAVGGPGARLGIVTAGKSYLDVRQALEHLGIDEAAARALGVKVFKLGLTWPLEPEGMASFAEGVEELLIVEEKRPLIEEQVKSLLYAWPQERRPRVVGKRDEAAGTEGWLLPPMGELSAERIALVIAARLARWHGAHKFAERVQWLQSKEAAAARAPLALPARGYLGDSARVPFYCSGCPHNTSTRVPEGSKAIAGVGCHFMATYIFPGSELFSPMGGEGSAWVGHAPFTAREHIFANMGDGTYYHSGLLAIRAAVSADARMTFKLLFNDATAATGGQRLPGALNVGAITRQLAAEGVRSIVVVTDEPHKYRNAATLAEHVRVRHRDELDAVQKELRGMQGVTALVYDQTCAAEKRRRRKRGTFADPDQRMFINSRVCEGCGDCSVQSNCVSVQPLETEFGRKRRIDQSACNKDFSCAKGFCPSFVGVQGARLRRRQGVALDAQHVAALPPPVLPDVERPFGIVIAGVGGTGVITLGAVLGMAAHLEGKGVTVLDMTGVAQKGGAVTTYVRIAQQPDALHSVRIAAGDARAIIGCDLLVTSENAVLTRARTGTTRAVVNTQRLAAVAFVRDRDAHTPWAHLEQGIRETVGSDGTTFIDASQLATALLGDGMASNMLLLGSAYQQGLVPVSAESIERAIELNGASVQTNLQAFQWGRVAICDPQSVQGLLQGTRDATTGSDQILSEGLDARIERRVRYLTSYQDKAYAQRYAELVQRVRMAEEQAAPGSQRLTEAVAEGWFRVLAIKDEYEVARLYTDGEFRRQLEATFEPGFRLQLHLAPPLWAKPDRKTGIPRKRTYGAWILPALRVLASLKRLRGTWLDVFGYTAERQRERRLIGTYQETIGSLLPSLDGSRVALASEIAALPAGIRGYGHVKKAAMERAEAQQASLLAKYLGTSGAIERRQISAITE